VDDAGKIGGIMLTKVAVRRGILAFGAVFNLAIHWRACTFVGFSKSNFLILNFLQKNNANLPTDEICFGRHH
jgi:hypothetical protein